MHTCGNATTHLDDLEVVYGPLGQGRPFAVGDVSLGSRTHDVAVRRRRSRPGLHSRHHRSQCCDATVDVYYLLAVRVQTLKKLLLLLLGPEFGRLLTFNVLLESVKNCSNYVSSDKSRYVIITRCRNSVNVNADGYPQSRRFKTKWPTNN